jgi:hypothetical protein
MTFNDVQENKEVPLSLRPGTAIAESSLYEPIVGSVVDGEGYSKLTPMGVKTPEEKYYRFLNGEEFVLIADSDSHKRQPFIRLRDGRHVPFDVWRDTQQSEIGKILEASHPLYAHLYRCLIRDYPELSEFMVRAGTIKDHPFLEYTGGIYQRPTEENPYPTVLVELNGKEKHYQKLLAEREVSARLAAERIGISFDDLKKTPLILALFIFAHELGHVHDYIVNFLHSKNSSQPNYDPVVANQHRRDEEMNSLPVPGLNPVQLRQFYDSGELEPYYQKYKEYYRSKNFLSVQDLLKAQEKAYRMLGTENYADDFAENALRRYWEELQLSTIAL